MPQFKLKDGRELEILDNGINSDRALIFHHGTPGHATTWLTWLDTAAAAGIRALSYSRPGYGTSDRNPGRSVISINSDIAQVLDAGGINSFISIGWSGGGPHCIANTFDARNLGAISLAGVGAYGVSDLDFLEGMGPENHDEFGAALKGEAAISKWMDTNAPAMQTVSGEDLISALGGLIGDADKRALTKEIAEEMAATFRSALKKGFTGWIDDDLAFVQPFGFELEKITKPVIIWQGNDDFMVPQSHSEWLHKHIPSSKLNFVPGHGHISIGESFRSEIIKAALEYLR